MSTINKDTKFNFNNQVIDFNHNLFDVVIVNAETSAIKEVVSEDEVIDAKIKKAKYLIEASQVTIYSEPIDVELVKPVAEVKKK